MGRLPKIVASRKSKSISIELITSSDGLFANSGFLFYALSSNVYFTMSENLRSKSPQQQRSSNKDDYEYNRLEMAVRRVEGWQVDACDSDMTECTIIVTDESMYKSVYDSQEKFHVGYLFGMNQYQPNGFTLKYVLRTKIFNTVAFSLEHYEPSAGPVPSAAHSDPCLINNLLIETVSRHLSTNTFDYAYYDDSSYDYQFEQLEMGLNSSRTANQKSADKKRKFMFSSKSNHYPNQKQSIVKLCNKEDFNGTQTRFFLVKTAQSRPLSSKARSDLIVSYFNLFATLSESARLNDFRISYEFVDFDWHAYQDGSLCNFVYDANQLDIRSGTLTNPKSRIFYIKSSIPYASDDQDQEDGYLRCKYRLVAKQNHYIRLTVKQVDFDVDNQLENVFFTTSDKIGSRPFQRCAALPRKLIIRDLQHSWSDPEASRSDMDFEPPQPEMAYDESSAEPGEKLWRLDTKLCLCRVRNDSELMYISKFDMIEIEYKVKLEDGEPVKMNNFILNYEFVDRGCSKLIKTSLKSNHKGWLFVYINKHFHLK